MTSPAGPDGEDEFGARDLYDPDARLSAVEKLEKYLENDHSYSRQLAARSVYDTLKLVVHSADAERVLKAIVAMSEDSDNNDGAVRSELMEQMPQIALFCEANKQLFNNGISQPFTSCLLPIVIGGMRDNNNQVRKASQAAVLFLVEHGLLSKAEIETLVGPVVAKLANSDLCDDFRSEAASLISKLVPLAGKDITERIFLQLFAHLCADTVFHIRKICATNFGDICLVVGQEQTERNLLQSFYTLCEDSVWGVRKACTECFMHVSRVCTASVRRTELTQLYVNLIYDQSRWVRIAAFESLGGFISTFADPTTTGLYVDEEGRLDVRSSPPVASPVTSPLPLSSAPTGVEVNCQCQGDDDRSDVEGRSQCKCNGKDSSGVVIIASRSLSSCEEQSTSNEAASSRVVNENISLSVLDAVLPDSCDAEHGCDTAIGVVSVQKEEDFGSMRYFNSLLPELGSETSNVSGLLSRAEEGRDARRDTEKEASKETADGMTEGESSPVVGRFSSAIENLLRIGEAINSEDIKSPLEFVRKQFSVASKSEEEASSVSISEAITDDLGNENNIHSSFHEVLPNLSAEVIASMGDMPTTNVEQEFVAEKGSAGSQERGTNDMKLKAEPVSSSQASESKATILDKELNVLSSVSESSASAANASIGASEDSLSENTACAEQQLSHHDSASPEELSSQNVNHVKELVSEDAVSAGVSSAGDAVASALESFPSALESFPRYQPYAETTPSSSSSNIDSALQTNADFAPPRSELQLEDDNSLEETVSMRDMPEEKGEERLEAPLDDGLPEEFLRIAPAAVVLEPSSGHGQLSLHNGNLDSGLKDIYLVCLESEISPASSMCLSRDSNDISLESISFVSAAAADNCNNSSTPTRGSSQTVIPADLLDQYLSMMEPSCALTVDNEVTRHCAYSLPAVALTLGRANWLLLQQLFFALANDAQWRVRRTLAYSLHELALIVGEEITARDLEPVFDGFLSDLDEVRVGVIKHLGDFLKLLTADIRRSYLGKLGALLGSDSSRNWRFREEVGRQVCVLLNLFSPADIASEFSSLAFKLTNDRVAQIRRVAIDVLSGILRRLATAECDQSVASLDRDKLLRDFVARLTTELAENRQWFKRQMYVQFCASVVQEGVVPEGLFVDLLLPALLRLSADPVPNVRITLARTLTNRLLSPAFSLRGSKDNGSGGSYREDVLATLKVLQADSDRDVRYLVAAGPVLQNLDADAADVSTTESTTTASEENTTSVMDVSAESDEVDATPPSEETSQESLRVQVAAIETAQAALVGDQLLN